MIRAILWSIAVVLALFCNATSAFERVQPTGVSISLASYHFDRETKHNEVNPGVFVEFNHAVVVGVYRNSLYRTTALLAYSWDFGTYQGIRFGALTGVCSGYKLPVCGVFTLGYGPVTLGIIPPTSASTGVVGLSLGYPL